MVTYKALGEPSDKDLSEHFPKSFFNHINIVLTFKS